MQSLFQLRVGGNVLKMKAVYKVIPQSALSSHLWWWTMFISAKSTHCNCSVIQCRRSVNTSRWTTVLHVFIDPLFWVVLSSTHYVQSFITACEVFTENTEEHWPTFLLYSDSLGQMHVSFMRKAVTLSSCLHLILLVQLKPGRRGMDIRPRKAFLIYGCFDNISLLPTTADSILPLSCLVTVSAEMWM